MNKQDIINHIKTNCPHGDELSFMLQHNPSDWQDFEILIQESLNFEEYERIVDYLTTIKKVINFESFLRYSNAFAEIGEDNLSEVMTKIEFILKRTYEINFNFLQNEILPYLKELYNSNKDKFDLRIIGTDDLNKSEQELIQLASNRLETLSIKITRSMLKKPIYNTIKFRQNKEVLILIESLTS